MRFNHSILFALIGLFLMDIEVKAQNQAIIEPQLMYRKQLMYGLNLNSTGIGGLNFKLGWHKTDKIYRILDLEFARVRDPKEEHVAGASENPQQYTYDRINMAFFLRTGYGSRIRITDRPYKNAFGLNFHYSFGVTSAILKPIYIDYVNIESNPNSNPITYITTERYDPNTQSPQNILGNASFFYGMNHTTMKFGGFARAGLSVEFGQYPDEFHQIEGGFTVDVFPDPLPLMANVPKRSYFFILYLAYTYGVNK